MLIYMYCAGVPNPAYKCWHRFKELFCWFDGESQLSTVHLLHLWY